MTHEQLKMASNEVIAKAKRIKLVIFDVDGVLTNGQLIYSDQGETLKVFNVKDGLGIKLLQKIQIKTAVITSRESAIVTKRMKELGVAWVFQGHADKKAAYAQLVQELSLLDEDVAYIGDDMPDLPLIKKAGLGVAVADAHDSVKQAADWVTQKNGGMGAVRELADLIIAAQERSKEILELFL